MKFPWQKQQVSLEEIHKFVDDLAEMMKLREKSIQNSRLYSTNTEEYKAEAAMYTRNIETAQSVLLYLQEGSLPSK